MPLRRPTTTPLPDEIYDEWAPKLGEAELKVLLYIVRRTLGFRKGADAISLTQFLEGIVARDGRVLDHGCGVKSRPNVVRALKGLEGKELILIGKRRSAAGDRDVTIYALRWEENNDETMTAGGSVETKPQGSVETKPQGSIETTPRWCRSDTEVVLQQNHGGVAATPTTNSIPTNRQQDSETTGASLPVTTLSHAQDAVDLNPRATDTGAALWRSVLDDLRGTMTAENFATWFDLTTAVKMADNGLIVTVRDPFQHYWLDTRLRACIERSLRRCGQGTVRVTFAVTS